LTPRAGYKSPSAYPVRIVMSLVTPHRNARACAMRIEAEPVPEDLDLRFKVRLALSADKTSIHIGNKSEGCCTPMTFTVGFGWAARAPISNSIV
jgi:hypothetical protein